MSTLEPVQLQQLNERLNAIQKQLELMQGRLEQPPKPKWSEGRLAGLLTIVVSVIVAALGLWGTGYTAFLAARATFATKAAEIIFSSASAKEAEVKATAIQRLFPWYFPGFIQAQDLGLVGGLSPSELQFRKDVIKLLADKPKQRASIVKDLREAVTDDWVKKIQPTEQPAPVTRPASR